MKILVNGAWRETVSADLGTVLQEMGYGDAVVATAVNGEFVPAGLRPTVRPRRRRPHRSAGADAGGLMLQVYGIELRSRLFLGTSRYPSPAVLSEAVKASRAQVVTVSLRRGIEWRACRAGVLVDRPRAWC